MSKRAATPLLTLGAVVLLVAAIWQTVANWAWLDAHQLAGVAVLDLLGWAFFTVILPVQLRSGDSVSSVLRRGGLMMLAFTAIGGFFLLIGYLFSIPARWERPYLLLPALLILLPIGLAFVDILRGIIQRTPANLYWIWLRHSFELYYMLLFQVGAIPVAFLLILAGFFLQIITLVEEGIRFFGEGPFDSLPLLCEWTNAGVAACAPTLITFHIGHLALAVLGLKFGGVALDKAADWYAAGLDWLGGQIEY